MYETLGGSLKKCSHEESGCVLEASWRPLGDLLEASNGVLEASWMLLGGVLEAYCSHIHVGRIWEGLRVRLGWFWMRFKGVWGGVFWGLDHTKPWLSLPGGVGGRGGSL